MTLRPSLLLFTARPRGKPGCKTRLKIASINFPIPQPGGNYRRASLKLITNIAQLTYHQHTGILKLVLYKPVLKPGLEPTYL
jgi:hypothetical protein